MAKTGWCKCSVVTYRRAQEGRNTEMACTVDQTKICPSDASD